MPSTTDPINSDASTTPVSRRFVGLLDELVDELRTSALNVLTRRFRLFDQKIDEQARTAAADEIARNGAQVVVAILEERGIL